MKKIVVLTDFSERAENAAVYAFHLAVQLNANIVLYHAFLSPAAQPYAAQVGWPLMNTGELEITNRKELELAASKLSKVAGTSVNFIPDIETRYDEGEITENLKQLLTDKDIVLFVMANHRKGFRSLLTGNHLKRLLDRAAVPVLIIPSTQSYRLVHKIAFATDLNHDDLEVLHSLSTMAHYTKATIMLAHIYQNEETQTGENVQQFLSEVSNKMNYPHIYYRHIKESEVQVGLKWVTENVAFDMLVMVHRHKSFFERFFNVSNTQKAAAETNLPLLVYPHPADTFRVF